MIFSNTTHITCEKQDVSGIPPAREDVRSKLSARLFVPPTIVKLVPARAKMAPADDTFVQTGCFSAPDQTTF